MGNDPSSGTKTSRNPRQRTRVAAMEVQDGTATAQPSGGAGPNLHRMSRLRAADVLGYVLPELHEGKRWYVDLYSREPRSGQLKRKVYKLNRIEGIAARRAYARQLIAELTRKLQAGWSPWAEIEAPKGYTTMEDALDLYDRVKERTLRHSSPYSYSSFTHVLREWCRQRSVLDNYVYAFNRAHAIEFMDYVSEQREVGNRTYNNYLVNLTMFYIWAIEKGFCISNPFKDFRKRKEPQKTRTFLTEQERQEMVPWVQMNDLAFLLPCMWIFATLIRPAELKRLRVGNVDLVRKVVVLPAEITKSGKERMVAIPDSMLPDIYASGLQLQPAKAWLVGHDLRPGPQRCARNTLNRHWVVMRKALAWGNDKQLYSLRDTGIIQQLRDGIDMLHVMQQAGHEDLATTNKYVRHAFPKGIAEVQQLASSLRPSAFAPGAPGNDPTLPLSGHPLG